MVRSLAEMVCAEHRAIGKSEAESQWECTLKGNRLVLQLKSKVSHPEELREW